VFTWWSERPVVSVAALSTKTVRGELSVGDTSSWGMRKQMRTAARVAAAVKSLTTRKAFGGYVTAKGRTAAPRSDHDSSIFMSAILMNS
jgi:hypothetical protein